MDLLGQAGAGTKYVSLGLQRPVFNLADKMNSKRRTHVGEGHPAIGFTSCRGRLG